MAKPWSEVAASPDFQALGPDEQEQARKQYFTDVVEPQVPNDSVSTAQEQFDTQTRSLKSLYNDTSFQSLDEDKQVGTIKKYMQAQGKINEFGYSPDSVVPSALQKLLPTDKEAKIQRKIGYELGDENQARRSEVLSRSLAAPINSISDAATQIGSAVTGTPYSEKDKQGFQEHRKSQAELDELQSRTAGTEGFQTVPALGVSFPLTELRPAQAAIEGAGAIGGWLKGAGIVADSTLQGATAGKALTPTSSAQTPNESPEEAASNYAKQSSQNTKTGAEIGAAVPAGAAVLAKGKEIAGAPFKWAQQLFGNTKEAETRTAGKFAEAYSASRGEPVSTTKVANEINQGVNKQNAVNKEFGTDFKLNTPQAAGDQTVTGMQNTYKQNIATGLSSAKNDIPNAINQGAKNEEEMAKLIKKSGQNLTPAQEEAAVQTAKNIGENPVEYIEKTYKPVDFDDLDKVVAGKKIGQDAVSVMETAKSNYDKLYNSIDPENKLRQFAPATRKAIEGNVQDLNAYGILTKADKKIISDFYGDGADASRKNTARELVNLNADLSDLAQRARSDPKLAPAYEAVQSIRQATKDDLAASTNTSVAKIAKDANDLFRKTQATLYERPEKLLGKTQPTALAELRNKAGAKTSLEDETAVNNLAGTSEDIADYRRGSKFVKGNTDEADRNVKNYLMADLHTSLRGSPSPSTFDTWAAKNATKIGSVPGFKRELLGLKASLVKEEQNIATATNIMGGRDSASKAMKGAMESPEKMQALVDLAQKDPTGNALNGMRRLFQEHVEDSLNTTIREGGKVSEIAEPTKYFDNLLQNDQTKSALKVLWGKDAKNLEEASDMFKRLNIERGQGIKPQNLSEEADKEIGKTVASQALPSARSISINSTTRVLNVLTNREFNRVMARAMADPEYAMKILNAYKEPSKANLEALMESVKNVGLPATVVEGKQKGKVNPDMKMPEPGKKPMRIPEGGRPSINAPISPSDSPNLNPESKATTDTKSLLSMLSPISEAEASDKVPYNVDYSKMLGKLPSNDHRHLANRAIEEAHRQGIDPKLAINIANAESNFKQDAKADTSSASGLFQITKGTAKDIKGRLLKDPSLDLNEPNNNIKAGVAYTKDISDKIEKATGKKPAPYLIYTGYHSGMSGVLTLLNPANQHKAAADLMPDAAKANKKMYYNPNGKPYTVVKVRQNLKDYYESKRLDK